MARGRSTPPADRLGMGHGGLHLLVRMAWSCHPIELPISGMLTFVNTNHVLPLYACPQRRCQLLTNPVRCQFRGVHLDMGVDHRRAHIGMTKDGTGERQRLAARCRDGAHGVAQRVRRDAFQPAFPDALWPHLLGALEEAIATVSGADEVRVLVAL